MTRPIRTLIVEDEPPARERLVQLLGDDPDLEVVGQCGDGKAAISRILELAPDLVFLDVQMPEMNGFEVLEALEPLLEGRPPPAVVFVTAFDEYAVRAFDVHAVDYLLKPFDTERFARAVARVKEHLESPGSIRLDPDLLATLRGRSDRAACARLIVKAGGRIVFLQAEEIEWIEARGNYARLHTRDGSYLHRETMAALERRLDSNRFIRIHRSSIVNLDRVRELRPGSRSEYTVVLRDGTELALGRTYRENLERLMGGSV